MTVAWQYVIVRSDLNPDVTRLSRILPNESCHDNKPSHLLLQHAPSPVVVVAGGGSRVQRRGWQGRLRGGRGWETGDCEGQHHFKIPLGGTPRAMPVVDYSQ